MEIWNEPINLVDDNVFMSFIYFLSCIYFICVCGGGKCIVTFYKGIDVKNDTTDIIYSQICYMRFYKMALGHSKIVNQRIFFIKPLY